MIGFNDNLCHHNRYAKQLRPTSLRALYGRDDVCNAVHSTDLADDAALEVDFFFSLMQ
jgi:nucleoside-diphosphate kinase